MGIVPLQFLEGQSSETLDLTGREQFSIDLPEDLKPGDVITVQVNDNSVESMSKKNVQIKITRKLQEKFSRLHPILTL